MLQDGSRLAHEVVHAVSSRFEFRTEPGDLTLAGGNKISFFIHHIDDIAGGLIELDEIGDLLKTTGHRSDKKEFEVFVIYLGYIATSSG